MESGPQKRKEPASQQQSPALVHYTIAEANDCLPSPFPAHGHYLGPPSPSTLPSPMMPSPEQYWSPPPISSSSHPHSQVCLQAYQVSPKMAELSPNSCAFPNCQSSHNPTSSAYGFNPTSHIQVSNSPGHPLAQTKNVCSEMYTEVPSMSTGNLYMSMPLQHITFPPPPDFIKPTVYCTSPTPAEINSSPNLFQSDMYTMI